MLNSEQDVLKFWKDNSIFEKSLDNRRSAEPFVFLDGPPFPTGEAHFGHVSTGYPKDIFPRYWTQKGKYSPRRWGWDCHGLPIENLVQKELGIFDKRQIENEIGIEKFNQLCRENIMKTDSSWRELVERSGRWVDMDDQYRTMDNDYMESVWWGLGQLWEKKLLYTDYRVSLYSPSMGATLSHLEVSDDISYTNDTLQTPVVRFKVASTSTKKLVSKILEEVNFNFSEQQRLKFDIEKRLKSLEKLDQKSRSRTLGDLLKGGLPEFKGVEWDNLQTNVQADEELLHLQDQHVIVSENLDTLQRIKDILTKQYDISLLSWTTTPWTLPANVALAVGADIEYSMYYLSKTAEIVILAEHRAIAILSLELHENTINSSDLEETLSHISDSSEYFTKIGVDIVKIVSFTGSDLQGIEYSSIFTVPLDIPSYEEKANIYKVYTSDFVTDVEGTGVLHVAPAYGAEDFQIRKERNLPVLMCLNEYGEMLTNLSEDLIAVSGKKFTSSNDLIVDILERNHSLFAKIRYTHKYPVYNRDNKKVYYLAKENWYIGETKILTDTLTTNKNIDWRPSHLKEGRFKLGLESAPDWCISRNRYWGTPLPIWQTKENKKTIFVDSIEKLSQHAINPIYKLLNTRDLNPDFYQVGKTVIISDVHSKLPLGIIATQHRSRHLTDLRKEKTMVITRFADFAQKILDEIYSLFEKYSTVQIIFTPEEQRLWTTWLCGLHPDSKKNSRTFYFYKSLKYDINEYIPTGGIKPLDLHRPYIDEIILKDEIGNVYTRVEDVIDCWVESGSMPFASYHYPFENKDLVERQMPADYIVEYEGQIRGWFHAIHVLSTAIFGHESFKHVHVHGTLLGNDNKKLSKSKKNYDSDPHQLLEKVGSDAIRLYFTSGPYFNGETVSMRDRDVITVFRDSTLLLSNSLKYIEYLFSSGLYNPTADESIEEDSINQASRNQLDFVHPSHPLKLMHFSHPLNQWWQMYTLDYAYKIDQYLQNYDIIEAAKLIIPYIQDFSTWYIRRSKDILDTSGSEVVRCLRQSMHLFAIVTASLQPFNSERIWSYISTANDLESVHLTDIPNLAPISSKQNDILVQMSKIREMISEIHAIRKQNDIRVRQPLYADLSELNLDIGLHELVKAECNFLDKNLELTEGEVWKYEGENGVLKVDLVIDHELKVLGFTRDFERAVQDYRKKQGYKPSQTVAMKWQVVEVEDADLVQEVIKVIDWTKLCVEVKWSGDLEGLVEKSFEVKGLCQVLVG
jgi:isoleucyl-tRNA synthetase